MAILDSSMAKIMAILVVNHAGKHGKIMGAWPDYLVSPQKMRCSPGSFGGLGIP
jgi:hypothetical protein